MNYRYEFIDNESNLDKLKAAVLTDDHSDVHKGCPQCGYPNKIYEKGDKKDYD